MKKNPSKKIKILMVAAEAAPLVKVGGLSDVVGSLPKALNKIGCDTRIIIPKYGFIDEKKYDLIKLVSGIKTRVKGRHNIINVWQAKKAIFGTTVYFIENERFSGQEVYNGDSIRRFFFFSIACLEALPFLGFRPDIIHSHDFHTASIPALLKTGNYPYLKDVKTVYTIHNLEHQGKGSPELFSSIKPFNELPPSFKKDAVDGDINLMVQGILNSDIFTTVSPTYATEITLPVKSVGLSRVIRANKHKLFGIINGIDTDFFNPAKDKFLLRRYSSDAFSGKAVCKADLQRVAGLPIKKDVALVGFISRLFTQKGLDLITEDLIKKSDCQFIFLGTGDEKYENQLKDLSKKYPQKVSAQITFDIVLAQKIYAGSDIFLMPSLFEPCGLGQMIAMRYGTVIIARLTGGLKDTVDSTVGFTFKNFKKKDLSDSLKNATDLYYNYPKKWLKLQKNCFKKDFSWNSSAKEYLKFYKKVLSI